MLAYKEKRFVDLTIAIPLLIVLIPIMISLGIIVWLKLGHPVLFRQQRAGLRGQSFTLLKFRTMRNERDRKGQFLPDDERLTTFGRFMRRTSLDELPELINVLRGEMSLVGPRPLLLQYLDRYTPEQARRHMVRPGITGWAQINGRNSISWEDKFKFDVWYVDNCSFWLDIKILAVTVWKVFISEGVSHKGHTSMPEFLGNTLQDGDQDVN